MRCVLCLLALVVGAGTALPAAGQAPVASVDLDQRYQTIEGWGTALTAGRESLYRDEAWRAAYRDLGLNIVRIQMVNEVLIDASGDFSVPVALGSDLDANIGRMNFDEPFVAMQAEVANWLKANALEPERVRVSGSVWTPPHWMKGPTGATQGWVGNPGFYDDDNPTPWLSNTDNYWRQPATSPTGDSIGGRLLTEDPWTLEQYGRYMAAWVEGFERVHGVGIDIMSIQNESTFENPFDSMTLIKGPPDPATGQAPTDFTQYAKALKAVKDAWQTFNVDTKVMGPHVAHFRDHPGNPFGLWWQRQMINGVKQHADPELIDFLDYYNANFYNRLDEGNVQNVAAFARGTDAVPADWADWFLRDSGDGQRVPGARDDGKGIWFSEAGGASASWRNPVSKGGTITDPVGNGAITVALGMFNALAYGDASAYLYWQMSDGSAQENQHILLGTDHLHDPHQSKKYAAFKHFARFIRPGAQRIAVAFDGTGAPSIGGDSAYDTKEALNVVGFFHEDDGRLTFVILNLRGDNQTLELALPDNLALNPFEVYRTSDTESFALLEPIAFAGDPLLIDAPAYSVTTLTTTVVPEPTTAAGLGALTLTLLVARRAPRPHDHRRRP